MKTLYAWLCALAVSLVVVPASAASDYLLKIDGIEGESKDSAHQNWIVAHTLAFPPATAPRDASTGQATGKRMWHPFVIVKRVDKSTPLLKQALAKSSVHARVTLDLVNGDGTAYRYTFTEVMVSGVVSMNPRPGDSQPQESITFVYGALEIQYKDQKTDWHKVPEHEVRGPKPVAQAVAPAASAR